MAWLLFSWEDKCGERLEIQGMTHIWKEQKCPGGSFLVAHFLLLWKAP
jgi:hypothetical protein